MADIFAKWLIPVLNKVGISLITAVVSFCVGRFWLDVLQPRIQNIFYKGMYLETRYTGEFLQAGTGPLLQDAIELKQKAERVWGTMTVPGGIWGNYEFEATLTNGILRGTFQSIGRATTSRGSFLLMTQAGSSELKGWCIEPIKGKVSTTSTRGVQELLCRTQERSAPVDDVESVTIGTRDPSSVTSPW